MPFQPWQIMKKNKTTPTKLEILEMLKRSIAGTNSTEAEAVTDSYIRKIAGISKIDQRRRDLAKVIENSEPKLYETLLAFFKEAVFCAWRTRSITRLDEPLYG